MQFRYKMWKVRFRLKPNSKILYVCHLIFNSVFIIYFQDSNSFVIVRISNFRQKHLYFFITSRWLQLLDYQTVKTQFPRHSLRDSQHKVMSRLGHFPSCLNYAFYKIVYSKDSMLSIFLFRLKTLVNKVSFLIWKSHLLLCPSNITLILFISVFLSQI